MKKYQKNLIACTMMAGMFASLCPPVFAKEQSQNYRLAGKNRIETSIKIADELLDNVYKGTDTAILAPASDKNLVDSLTVAPLAHKLKSAIFLNDDKNKINEKILERLKKHNIKEVYICTGEGVISKDVAEKLKNQGIKVKRLGGKDRYETSENILKELTLKGVKIEEVAVVSNNGIPDALSMASIAAQKEIPIILTRGKDSIDECFKKTMSSAKNVFVLGGNGIISDSLVKEVRGERLGGKDRYETNAKIISRFYKDKISNVYIANGENAHLVDSLTGSILAATTGAPIVLSGENLSKGTRSVLKTILKDNTVITTLGSEKIVSEKIVSNVVDDKLKKNEVIEDKKPEGNNGGGSSSSKAVVASNKVAESKKEEAKKQAEEAKQKRAEAEAKKQQADNAAKKVEQAKKDADEAKQKANEAKQKVEEAKQKVEELNKKNASQEEKNKALEKQKLAEVEAKKQKQIEEDRQKQLVKDQQERERVAAEAKKKEQEALEAKQREAKAKKEAEDAERKAAEIRKQEEKRAADEKLKKEQALEAQKKADELKKQQEKQAQEEQQRKAIEDAEKLKQQQDAAKKAEENVYPKDTGALKNKIYKINDNNNLVIDLKDINGDGNTSDPAVTSDDGKKILYNVTVQKGKESFINANVNSKDILTIKTLKEFKEKIAVCLLAAKEGSDSKQTRVMFYVDVDNVKPKLETKAKSQDEQISELLKADKPVDVNTKEEFNKVIAEAITQLKPSFVVNIPVKDVSNYNFNDYNDLSVKLGGNDFGKPEIGSNGVSYMSTDVTTPMTITLKYRRDINEVRRQKQLTEEAVKRIIKEVIKPSMTDVEKELALHDYVVKHADYNMDGLNKSPADLEDHSAYGVLVLGKGVCESYAKAMHLLLNAVGVECKYATGFKINSNGSKGGGHAWNMVKLDGEWYNLDATWDDPVSDRVGRSDKEQVITPVIHTYFNVKDNIFNNDHIRGDYEEKNYPAANGTKYSYDNLDIDEFMNDGTKVPVVGNKEELISKIKEAMSKKQTSLYVRVKGFNISQKDLMNELGKVLDGNIYKSYGVTPTDSSHAHCTFTLR